MNNKKTLCQIAAECGTDKVVHGYTKVYDELFSEFREDKINVLELGVLRGCSLRMWKNYFENSNIYGLDDGCINQGIQGTLPQEFEQLRKEGFTLEQVDQKNRVQLDSVVKGFGKEFDLILDDAAHYQEHQQISLGVLFPYVKSGKFYVVEDVIVFYDLSERKDWGYERNWGLRDSISAADSTLKMLEKYNEGVPQFSLYMTHAEEKYLYDNIEYIKLYYPNLMVKDSPITGTSAVAIIKKR